MCEMVNLKKDEGGRYTGAAHPRLDNDTRDYE